MEGGDSMMDSINNGRRTARDAGVSRYDLVLAVIPAALLLSLLAGHLLSIPSRTALVAGAVVGLLAMMDGLFRNPPEGTGPA